MDIPRKTWIIIGIVVGLLLIGFLPLRLLEKPEAINRLRQEVRMGMTAVEVREIARIKPLYDEDMGEGRQNLGYSQRGNIISISFVHGKASSMRHTLPNSKDVWVFSERMGIPDADGTVKLPDDPNASSQPGW